jgi:hypothetical protein
MLRASAKYGVALHKFSERGRLASEERGEKL